MLKFNIRYFLLTLALFITEVLIGVYAHDRWIRPYGGDVLIGILIYCFIKSFFKLSVWPTTIAVLLFCYVVETLQYFHFVGMIGLAHSRVACIVLGTSFSWVDMLSYTIGMGLVVLMENLINPANVK